MVLFSRFFLSQTDGNKNAEEMFFMTLRHVLLSTTYKMQTVFSALLTIKIILKHSTNHTIKGKRQNPYKR